MWYDCEMKTYKCSVCGKTFERYSSQVVDGKKVCCSRKCVGKRWETEGKGKGNPNYRHGRCIDDKVCACGNPKDVRSIKCARCARRGSVRSGAVSLRDIPSGIFRKTIKESGSFFEVGKKLGVARRFVKQWVASKGIDISHFVKCRNRTSSSEDVLVNNGKRRNGIVKTCVLRENLVPYICGDCGRRPEWNGKPLTLQIHHKDGDSTNNEIGNLGFLCPNCHTQTKTYTGRNKNMYSKKHVRSAGVEVENE